MDTLEAADSWLSKHQHALCHTVVLVVMLGIDQCVLLLFLLTILNLGWKPHTFSIMPLIQIWMEVSLFPRVDLKRRLTALLWIIPMIHLLALCSHSSYLDPYSYWNHLLSALFAVQSYEYSVYCSSGPPRRSHDDLATSCLISICPALSHPSPVKVIKPKRRKLWETLTQRYLI